jgi:sporulation protein YlmC with PRC-barrel domain
MRTAPFAAFAMFLAVTAAHAQQTPSSDTSSNKAPATTPIAGIDDAALAGSARASKLIGSKVYQGDTSIGQIEDVLVDLDHATLTAVILSVGGVLGLGNKLVAVPVNQIKVGSEAKFTTDLTKEQLTSAPTFNFGKLK